MGCCDVWALAGDDVMAMNAMNAKIKILVASSFLRVFGEMCDGIFKDLGKLEIYPGRVRIALFLLSAKAQFSPAGIIKKLQELL